MKSCIWLVLIAMSSTALNAADGPSTRPTTGVAALKHLQLDLRRRRIVMDAEVCRRTGLLEFLVCRTGTKEHESVLRTLALPSDLHAAFLALGLSPGRPARWSGEGEHAAFLPPQGAAVKIALHWRDEKGKDRRAEARSWIARTGERSTAPPKHWIFVGSEIFPDGSYWADMEGDVVSVANFGSSVLDVPFESSTSDEILEFQANPEAVPPVGTRVRIIFSPLPGAERADHARALMDIDRFGKLRVDGAPIAFERLRDWAGEYLSRHSKGAVVLRPSARALVWDVERVGRELRVGGVMEFDEQRFGPSAPILPRTPAQLTASLRIWAKKFANPREYIVDPGEDAEALLRDIDRRVRELDALKQLWGEYAAHLRKALKQYGPTTKPSGSRTPR